MQNETLPAVLLVHCRYRLPGGEDSCFETEAELLRQKGHRVVCYERTNAELDGHFFKKLLLPFTAIYSFKTAREIRTLIAENQIDLVHVHNTFSVLSPSVFYACFAAGVPVVQTLHNFRLLCPNGVFLREGDSSKKPEICEDCPQKGLFCAVKHRCYRGSAAQSAVAAMVLWAHRLLGTYRRVNVIALTAFDREIFLRYNQKLSLFSPEKIFLKPHAVVCPATPPAPLEQRENEYLFVGRLETLKGVETLLEGWKILTAREREADAPRTLLLAGDGPLKDWAEEFCRQNGLFGVRFLGRVPHEELPGLLNRCRAALVPSLCYESFGLAAAESLMEGTPVLGSALGNTGAFICSPGEESPDSQEFSVPNGLRFAAGDANALADAVQKLDEILPKLNAAAIRADAEKKFGREQNYAALLAIYRQMLGE